MIYPVDNFIHCFEQPGLGVQLHSVTYDRSVIFSGYSGILHR
jgi:hypothetical protein